MHNENTSEKSKSELKDEKQTKRSNLIVKLNEVPAFSLCVLLGVQHYITMFGGTITYPFLLSSKLCIRENDPARGYLIATTLFCSGFSTVIQATFGVRLPIIQGPSFAFLIPTISLLSLPQWKCPTDEEILLSRPSNHSYTENEVTVDEYNEVWYVRMREVQGAMIVASLVEMIIGFTGIVGFLLKYITPLSIVPTISLIGLSLFQEASNSAGTNWLFSLITMIFMILFSQYFTDTSILLPNYNKSKGLHIKRVKFFRIFPVLLTILIVWAICGFLTFFDILGEKNAARTDSRINILLNSEWIRVPYPFQWGTPSFTVSAALGFLAGVLATTIESVGDYYACARLCETPMPPKHAVNRGIFIEGIGCLASAVWGSGGGLTSFSENIGAIGITKVGSRRVVQTAGFIMMLLSVFCKFSGMFATIPVPIIGGVFTVMFGIITAVGLCPLQFIDLNSHRNLFVIGFSIFVGICIPKWVAENPGVIQTGSAAVDQALTVLGSTGMLVGGLLAFIFDNTLPGTDEERGIHKWLVSPSSQDDFDENDSSYDLPFGLHEHSLKCKFLSYIPISSTYTGEAFNAFNRRKNSANSSVNNQSVPRIEITRI